jgi:hypothetical protein
LFFSLKNWGHVFFFVARRQYRAVTTNFYGTVLVEERIVNQIDRGGWMEGDLLDVAMSMEDCTQPMKAVGGICVGVLPQVEWECQPLQEVHRAPRQRVPAVDAVPNPGGSALASADLPTRYCAVVCMWLWSG